MSAENGKVCCNCRHCLREKDTKYDIIVCRCEKKDISLSYAEVMGDSCRHWARKKVGDDNENGD